MHITIRRNKAKFESAIHSFNIVLTKRLKLTISLNRPISFKEMIRRLKKI